MRPGSRITVLGALLVALCSLNCAALAAPAAQKLLRLAMMEGAPLATTTPTKVLREAYGRMGYELEITPMPFARSLASADRGDFDGELCRLAHIEESTSHLIRVPVAVGLIEYTLYTMGPVDARLKNWDAIRASQLRIGARQGARLIESSLRKDQLTLANSYESLFQMLLLNRIDGLIAPRGQLDLVFPLLPDHLRGEALKIREGASFTSEPLYHYLHERNADLVDRLAVELRRMEKTGTKLLVPGPRTTK